MNDQTRRLPRLAVLLLFVWSADHPAQATSVTGRIADSRTGETLPARLYVRGDQGSWHFAESADPARPAVRYAKTNWINPNAVECHVTLPAAPFRVDLPPGTYTLIVERGKEYRPLTQQVEVATQPVELSLPIRRWINMAQRGWYSGETHLHRTPAELTNVVLAEDLNVTFPLSFWVTQAFAAPGAGDRNMAGDFPARPLYADSTHVIWPRNTEYEIFTVGDRPHTLGALFLLNHRSVFTNGTPPWGPVAAQARAEGALLDMDKLDWAFAFLLPPVTGAQLCELANNHMWRTEYAFTNYVSFASPYLHPPYGSSCGSERDWTLYTLGMYYTLLNAGFRSVPAAGTASGVHPVPAGFSRVYVHLPDGFSYEKWVEGLAAGRSFVTTGPMLFAQVNERPPGETLRPVGGPARYRVNGTVVSEEPLAFIEVLHNGIAVRTIMPQNREGLEGARESSFDTEITTERSGWIAVRCWEERPIGRFRWAHTAPWHIEVPGKPLRPRAEEKAFLIERMKLEIERSRGVLPPEAHAEYERALAAYERLETEEEDVAIAQTARAPRNDRELRDWLENMIWHHGFRIEEVRAATGLTSAEVRAAQERHGIHATNRPTFATDAPLRVLPYPGGRHPRTGFLDGALRPQRDTKISAFTPWDDRSYVVVDVPEALWSNLGLTYLAHEHIETIWTKTDAVLEPLEWNRHVDGSLDFERTLPNGIVFGTRVVPGRDAVRMESWLSNGTTNVLTGLRLQNCVMLKAAKGFHAQTAQNKVLRAPYAACRSEDGRRWVITAWDPLDGVWQNPPVPCMHSNGRLADCPPGQTVRARGWLSFYEGTDVAAELERIENTGWRSDSQSQRSKTESPAASPDHRPGMRETGSQPARPRSGRVKLTILDAADAGLMPARVHLFDAAGQPVLPPSLPAWHDHFVCPGEAEVELPPGDYRFEVERGPEYERKVGAFSVSTGGWLALTNQLHRLADLAAEGWWSGDLHVHRDPAQAELLLAAEDLHIAPFITWWNQHNLWAHQPLPSQPVQQFVYARFVHLLAGEDRREGGALLYFNLDKPFDIARATREYPHSLEFARNIRQEPGAWIEIEKPFWWDVPAWLAAGVADSIGLANNHQQRGGMLDNEAWGKPRDRARLPSPEGNGLWSQELDYKILNAGFRLPPSAGSASGVLPNPVGYNRVYVHVNGELTWTNWWEGLRAGRVFVSNGPLLRCHANGQLPGHVFTLAGSEAFEVALRFRQ